MSSSRTDWETPPNFFRWLTSIVGNFDLDVAAREHNTVCDNFLEDGLGQSWHGDLNWCNPPYGREIKDWVKKMKNCAKPVIALVPARTDTKWFQNMVPCTSNILFIKGRLNFQIDGKPLNSAPFPSALAFFNVALNRKKIKLLEKKGFILHG
jgi:phage N-6-adenine-methyltransferase